MDIKHLVNELAFGNGQSAMEELYMFYYSKLILFISYYIKSKHEAEEIVSDTFFTLWEGREKLLHVKNLNAYIYTVAKSKAIDYLKSKEKRNRHVSYDISEAELLISSSSDPEIDFIGNELVHQLDSAIESLSTQNKIAFKLVRELKLKYKDAAEIMGISVKTLEAHVSSAIKKLEAKLDKELNNQ